MRIPLPRFLLNSLPILMVLGMILGGGYGTYYEVERIYGYWRTRGGSKVSARVIAVKFEAAQSKSPASTTARYAYEVDGRAYESDRVAVLARTDGYYPMLSEALRSGQRINVFIDPRQPAFASIDRTWAWNPVIVELPMCLFLLGMGVFFARELWHALRDPERIKPAYYFQVGRS